MGILIVDKNGYQVDILWVDIMTKNQLYKLIISKLIENAAAMIENFLLAIPIGIVAGIIVWWILKKKCIIKKRQKAIILFSSYIAIVLQISIFFREFGSVKEIDLIPFNMPGGVRYIILYTLANAVVFIPIGILLPMIWQKMNNVKLIFIAGFTGSLFIEIAQLIFQCGVCQTEDLIMNTVGAGIGYWIYKIYKRK